MALSDAAFATALASVFDWMEELGPGGLPHTKAEIALKLAQAINTEIKTLTATIVVPNDSVVVSVTGQAQGTKNSSPLPLTQVSIT
jgi:hypothetical protein